MDDAETKQWLPGKDALYRVCRAVVSAAHLTLRAQGLSSCCQASVDRSQLIQAGRWKGSGWIYCSKCRAAVSHVRG
jgi:hypothetical protein